MASKFEILSGSTVLIQEGQQVDVAKPTMKMVDVQDLLKKLGLDFVATVIGSGGTGDAVKFYHPEPAKSIDAVLEVL